MKFDTIVSDGAANGWNNIAGARKYETLIERFFANTELRTVFFHDHLFANSHQMHGMFGAMIIEEAGATFHSVRSGKKLRRGTQAVIRRKDGTSFREFALFVHDFAFLFDGNPLNPPEVPGSHDDPGVMGVNYRCEPMRERLKCHEDPAYIYSSFVHGDPATPILETYPGDEIIIRLLDGAHEEQHEQNVHDQGGDARGEELGKLAPDIAAFAFEHPALVGVKGEGHRRQPRQDARRVPALVAPRLEVVARERRVEPDLLRVHGDLHQLTWGELLSGGLVSDGERHAAQATTR